MNALDEKTLNVFDIDGTLFNTDTGVLIVHKDTKDIIRRLGHGEYDTYKLKPEETHDYSEMRNANRFRTTAVPVIKVLELAKHIVENQHVTSLTILLTARADFHDHDEFLRTFKDFGFPIDKTYVERAGNVQNARGSDGKKSVILKKYIASGLYNRINIWDDSLINLKTLKKLEKTRPGLVINTYLVTKDGNIEQHSATLSEKVIIPHESLNIGRALMPQIPADKLQHFLGTLDKDGIKHGYEKLAPHEMKATQSEFSVPMVNHIMKTKPKLNPVIVSSDNYILDGHHRWLASYNTNKSVKNKVLKIHTPILELLRRAKNYEHVEFRTVSDSEKRRHLKETINNVVQGSIKNRIYK